MTEFLESLVRIFSLAGLGCLSLSGCGVSDDPQAVREETAIVAESLPSEERQTAPSGTTGISSATLDLSLPDEDGSGGGASPFASEQDLLPDMFAYKPAEESEDTTAFGGRVVMDEEDEGYSLNSIRGAEITFEVKTF